MNPNTALDHLEVEREPATPLVSGRNGLLERAGGSLRYAPMRNGRTATRRRSYVRKAHALLGLALSANLLILLVTGFLIQHREDFRLDERTVPRWMVPNSYRPQDGPEGVRADIVITDLHSGRVFGNRGALVVDALTIAWFGLLISGLAVYGLGKWKHENGGLQEGNGNGEG